MAKINNDDLDPHHERVLREMISKEMLKKIQNRVDNEDTKVLNSIKSLLNEQTQKKAKIENKIKNILKEKKQEGQED